LHRLLVDWVQHVYDFQALLLEGLQEGALFDGLQRISRYLLDGILAFLHARYLLLERYDVFARFGGLVAQHLGHLSAVGAVFVDA